MNKPVTIYNGIFTVDSPRGGHRTFKIRTQKPEALFAPGQRLISLLNGPDNEADYKKFGFVTDSGINVFHKLRSGPFPMYATMLWSLATKGENSQFHKKGYRLLQSNTCLRCNRRLTVGTSIYRGLGPECYKLVAQSVP